MSPARTDQPPAQPVSRTVEAQGLAALLNLDAYVEQVRADSPPTHNAATETPATPPASPGQPPAAAPAEPVAVAKTAGGFVTNRSANGPVPGSAARPALGLHPDFVDTEPAHRFGLDDAAVEPGQHAAGSSATAGRPHGPSLGRVGPYELHQALPHDGLGLVFKARDSHDGSDVMVTLLDLDASARERDAVIARMQKSVLAAAALQHPGLARIVDAGVVGEGVYIVNEWAESRSLGMAQRTGWQPTARVAACVVRDLALALAHAHAHGVVHGGLNPSTVRLDADDKAVVLGLGFAATAHASDLPSMDPLVSGAAPYLAPEQLQGGEIDERTDIHALGVLLYELLAGHRAYPGDTVPEVAKALMSHDPAPPHWLRLDVPERLSAIAMQALQRNPAARYAEASDMAAALDAWLEQSESDTEDAGAYFVPAQPGRRGLTKKGRWVAASLLAAAAAVWAFTWVDRSERTPGTAADAAPAMTVPETPARVGATAAPPAEASGAVVAAASPELQAQAEGPARQASAPGPSKPPVVTEVPAGAVQPTTAVQPAAAAAPAMVAPPALVPAAQSKAEVRNPTPSRARATAGDTTASPRPGKAVARDRAKAGASDARAAAAPTRLSGTVQLAVSPWGYVEVDGKTVGASPPLRKLTLPEGTHTITIRNEDFLPFTTTVQVSPEKAASVRHRFAQ